MRKHKKNLLFFLGFGICGLVIILIYILWDLPDPTRLTTNPAPASTKLLDRHGTLIYEIYVDQRRTPIKLVGLPQTIKYATLAAEDKDFYSHSGFSLRGITRAVLNTFFRGHLQGGSTITQQLVKKAFLNDDRTPIRKIRELALSLLVELRYSKDQILEFYLNQVPYGGTAYGIESATQTYFGTSATDLTLAQSALLAGLPQAPSYYSPFGSHPEYGLERQKYVLDQMLANNLISAQDHAAAVSEKLDFSTPVSLKAPHFSLWVKDKLIAKYGSAAVYEQGLIVTTSLDLSLQDLTQETISSEISKLTKAHVTNGAAAITNPKTGEILAMVGSKDYSDTAGGGNVNVTLRPRQPGSSIKPVNYAIGIDKGLFTASTVLSDKPTCFSQADQKLYCPTNYDKNFHGPTQVRYALGNSFNIPAVKALVLTGLDDFVAMASGFGLTTFKNPKDYGPSITLGGGEITLLDLSVAYGVLANSGQRVDPNPVLHIQDRFGNTLEKISATEITLSQAKKLPSQSYFTLNSKYYLPSVPPNTRIISPGTAFIISHLLLDNGARSAVFGSHSYLNVAKHPEVAVKTGTTNDKRDNWTVGFNPDILVNVWVGNNDNSPMGSVASGVTGASPIWNTIITTALADSPPNWPIQPPDVVGKLICSTTGLLASNPAPPDCSPRYEYFLRTHVPPPHISLRQDIHIYRPTQAPATNKQISEEPHNIEFQNHAVVKDPLDTLLCLDCAGGYGDADIIHLDRHGRAIP